MARKWSNLNLPGALHFVTGNCINRLPVFTEPECCKAFLEQLKTLSKEWPAKLIAYVLMPDHFHFHCQSPRWSHQRIRPRPEKQSGKGDRPDKSSVSLPGNRRRSSGMAGKLQGDAALEWLDDQSEDSLHSCQSGKGKAGEVCERRLLVKLSLILLPGR